MKPVIHLRGAAISSLLIFVLISISFSCTLEVSDHSVAGDGTWKATFENDLNLLGHRNWILVVDKAFPEQSSEGMKYIYVDQELQPTLKYVLEKIESSTHVSPVIFQDKELSFVTEEQVAGISEFRSDVDKILAGREVNSLLHEDVFKLLDESSALFRTLVIKTNCNLPYTSVFLQLDCSYWGEANEQELRKRMED